MGARAGGRGGSGGGAACAEVALSITSRLALDALGGDGNVSIASSPGLAPRLRRICSRTIAAFGVSMVPALPQVRPAGDLSRCGRGPTT